MTHLLYSKLIAAQTNAAPNSPMKRSETIELLQQHQATLQAMGVKSLAIFGSVARDKARPDSDVDVLVELAPPNTFDQYMNVKFFLEAILSTAVDLVTLASLKPQLKAIVESEAIRVA